MMMDEQSRKDLRFVSFIIIGAMAMAVVGFCIEHWQEIREMGKIILP